MGHSLAKKQANMGNLHSECDGLAINSEAAALGFELGARSS